ADPHYAGQIGMGKYTAEPRLTQQLPAYFRLIVTVFQQQCAAGGEVSGSGGDNRSDAIKAFAPCRECDAGFEAQVPFHPMLVAISNIVRIGTTKIELFTGRSLKHARYLDALIAYIELPGILLVNPQCISGKIHSDDLGR